MQSAHIIIPDDMIAAMCADDKLRVTGFITMCRELADVVKAENELILRTGTSVGDANFLRKIELINAFEHAAQSTFALVRSVAPDNQWLHLYLVSEIGVLRHAFKINTALHRDDLTRRQARFSQLQQGIVSQAISGDGGGICH